MYDVSNRKSFEALPRWNSELEAYVSEFVVKIIVGNKVDQVCRSPHRRSAPFLTPAQESSRQVPTSEGEAFAHRINSLFIETSAKTAVGVGETFRELVEKILDTPELWASGAGQHAGPNGIDLDSDEPQSQGGCAC